MAVIDEVKTAHARDVCKKASAHIPKHLREATCNKVVVYKQFDTADFAPSSDADLVPTGTLPKLPGGVPIWAIGLISLTAVGVGVGVFAYRRKSR